MSKTNLEAQISTALGDTNATAAALTELLAECDAGIAQAEQKVARLRTDVFDPEKFPDPKVARAQLEDSEFEAGRLATLRPRLLAHLGATEQREAYEAWRAAHDQYKPVVDEAAERFACDYQTATQMIVTLYEDAARIDARSSEINGMAPPGSAERLRSVELLARNLAGFSTAAPSITANTVLPSWDHSDQNAWPIKQSIASALLPPAAYGFNDPYSGTNEW